VNASGRFLQVAVTAALICWFLSWCGLYLEIFRWHHVVLAQISGVIWPDPQAAAKPGGFVRTVVVSSIVIPPIALALMIRSGRPILAALSGSAVVCGIVLALLGAVNQFAQPQGLAPDLTLRMGNTGFIAVGALLAAAGLILRRRRPG
jgi:hypothetical protein